MQTFHHPLSPEDAVSKKQVFLYILFNIFISIFSCF